jgi:ABC-2 type transport system ATP-binding protein
MITTRGLTKQFSGRLAVSDLTLQINEGEIFGLLGPNGAGKTTTVRMLACLIKPTAGEAAVNGFQVGRENAQIRRSIGLVTEVPGLYEKLSALRNLEIYAKLYGVKNISKQVEHYMRLLGLWERRMDNAGTFSKGMKQKLAIARMLIHEPKVLFLDEPTSGLDPQTAKALRDFIAHLKEQKRTVLLCTHNLDEAERLCDRVAVLQTRLLAMNTPNALRHQLFGRSTIVQLRAADETLLKATRSLEFVREATLTDNKLVVTVIDPEAQNPLLIRALVAAGAQIQYVTELEHSLEEVYLKLIK